MSLLLLILALSVKVNGWKYCLAKLSTLAHGGSPKGSLGSSCLSVTTVTQRVTMFSRKDIGAVSPVHASLTTALRHPWTQLTLPIVKASCSWERGKALTLENTGLTGQGSPRTKPEGLWVSGAP